VTEATFKSLPHYLGSYHFSSYGNEVSKGYKPDFTISDSRNQLVFIIEVENKTDRKAVIGDLVKAEKHAEDCGAHPVLVIVMREHGTQTTVKQIANQLMTYATWLDGLKSGRLNLADVLVLSDEEYQRSIEAHELLGSPQFVARALSAKKNSN
jgi:hypothetical protein